MNARIRVDLSQGLAGDQTAKKRRQVLAGGLRGAGGRGAAGGKGRGQGATGIIVIGAVGCAYAPACV